MTEGRFALFILWQGLKILTNGLPQIFQTPIYETGVDFDRFPLDKPNPNHYDNKTEKTAGTPRPSGGVGLFLRGRGKMDQLLKKIREIPEVSALAEAI